MNNKDIQTYLNRFCQRSPYLKDFKPSFINIVIPSFREDFLFHTLESLERCVAVPEKPNVLAVLNQAEGDYDSFLYHRKQKHDLEKKRWKNFDLHVLLCSFPLKDAGVGMARKFGMDEVVHHCNEEDLDSFLICLDADCTVSSNYLSSLYKLRKVKKADQVVLYFEHPYHLEQQHSPIREGIVRYELFLRYYRFGLSVAGFPFAFHTVGSAMGCRIETYIACGGMNKRKAGEDFYFLGKLFPLGNTLDLKNLCVYPSCRVSDRVPFGTGRFQQKFVEKKEKDFLVYHPDIFRVLKEFFQRFPFSDDFSPDEYHPALGEYLRKVNWDATLREAKKNARTPESLKKRLYQKADVFFVLKAVHFLRDHHHMSKVFPSIPVLEAAGMLYEKSFSGVEEALEEARQTDRLR